MSENPNDIISLKEIIDEDARNMAGCDDSMACTYPKGYVKRQAIYSCVTCFSKTGNKAGLCYPCSVKCHSDHEVIDLYTKRSFRCDCGNTNFPEDAQCLLDKVKDTENEDNTYNDNFCNKFCVCETAEGEKQKKTHKIKRHTIQTKWSVVALKKHTSYSDRRIAECLGINVREVKRVFKKFETTGTVEHKSGGDQKSLLNHDDKLYLAKILEDNPSITGSQIKEKIKTEKDINMSVSTIYSYMKKIGVRSQVSAKRASLKKERQVTTIPAPILTSIISTNPTTTNSSVAVASAAPSHVSLHMQMQPQQQHQQQASQQPPLPLPQAVIVVKAPVC